jgi:hypothetical protein
VSALAGADISRDCSLTLDVPGDHDRAGRALDAVDGADLVEQHIRLRRGVLPRCGFLRQETVPLATFLENQFARCYA